MQKFTKKKRFDLYTLLAILCIAAWVSVYFKLGLLASIALYIIAPAIFLCVRRKKNYKKIILACSTLAFLLGLSLDIIAEHNHSWSLHFEHPFSYLLFGILPLGVPIWGFSVAFFTVVFYEHFLDDERNPAVSKHFLYMLLPYMGVFLTVFLTALLNPQALNTPYAYLVLMSVAEAPLVWVMIRRPHLLHKILWLGTFFFTLNFVFEITALSLHQWSFPGQYLGWLRFGDLAFPLEELVFWIAFSSPALIFYYEELFDDGK